MIIRTSILFLLLAWPLSSARAQLMQVTQPPLLPARNGTAPLLHIKFLGPPGMQVTFYQGSSRGRTFPGPVVAGMRPGYAYRMEITGLPQRPGVSLFPTVEVRGTLRLPARVNAATFPAAVVLTEADIEAVLAGELITKVIYLENAERAAPELGTPDEPLEVTLPATRDLFAEAWELGRPVLVLRIGQRLFTPEEMAKESTPGTILLPGEKSLSPALKKPTLPALNCPGDNADLGSPYEDCIRNGHLNPNRGGDGPIWPTDRVWVPGLDNENQLQGLRPEDTIAEYTDSSGRRSIAYSNRVCLCVPRFGVLRHETPLSEYGTLVGPNETQAAKRYQQLQDRTPPGQAQQKERLLAVQSRKKPSGMENQEGLIRLTLVKVLDAEHVYQGPVDLLGTNALVKLTEVERALVARQMELALELSVQKHLAGTHNVTGLLVVGRIENGPELVTATVETRDLTSLCQERPHALDRPLVLIKWCDRHTAKVGDVVTFFLRYSNLGGKPMTDIAVNDSLTTRLEYIPGSAQSSRAAVFTTQENDAGSVILRWEVVGKLLPGESGTVRFQARIR
jgi:uncharacterized repeat protein (TIGR01451 family)